MRHRHNTLILISFMVSGCIIIGGFFYTLRDPKTIGKNIDFFIGRNHFIVEIAKTEQEQSLGLAGRESLNDKAGMLFIFPEPKAQEFWMKDMKFPIDIVWIDKNKKVIGFKEEAQPADFPKTYASPGDVLYVLEINAGEVKNDQLKIGDPVNFDEKAVQKLIE